MSDAREAAASTGYGEHPPSGRRSEQSDRASDAREAPAGTTGGEAPSSGRRSERPNTVGRWTARLRLGLLGLWAAALLVIPVLARDDLYLQTVLILIFLLAVMASGWNIISGFAGYVSLGQSAFLGLGAYAVALVSARLHLSPLVLVPVGAVAAAVLAALLGAIVMRARGHAFVIITIAVLLLMQTLALNLRSFTGGSNGLTLPLPSWNRDYQNFPFYYLMLALMWLSVLLAWWVRRSKLGMGLVAIREDEDKASALGVNTFVYKILGFVASAVLIGAAGGVYGYYLTFIEPRGMFDILVSVEVVLAVLIGGRGTLWGPVLGAFVVQPFREVTNAAFGTAQGAHLLAFGLLLVATVLFLPRGAIPAVSGWLQRRRSAAAGRLDTGSAGEPALPPRVRTAPVEAAPVEAAPSNADRGTPLLEVRGLSKRFGGVHAVDGCSFEVARGTITALIGPNGSGKTTVFNLVTGMVRPERGEVWFDGRRIDRLTPWARSYLGLGRTFQITRLFPRMTVLENVVAPVDRFSLRQLGASAVGGAEAGRARELLDFVGMLPFAGEPAGNLSFGQQKLVELAQTLMLEPSLILLDEPAGGINPRLVDRMVELVRDLARQGVTFLIVEHNMPMVLDLCDPVLVLARGARIAEGAPGEIRENPTVLEAYLGEGWARGAERPLEV